MFKVNELLKVTQGRLIQGNTDTAIIKGISIDSRTIGINNAFIAIKGDIFDGHDFIDEAIRKGARCIIKEQKIQKSAKNYRNIVFIEVKNTVRALGDIACFQRQKFNIPLIAVTGSNGKTTTKEMLAWILSKRYRVLKNEGTKNNHIGLPLTLLNLNANFDLAILEIGTNHFGEVEYLTKLCQPNIGIITDIQPAHLEFLHNLRGVFKEKYTLIENLKKPYIAILNADNNLLKRQIRKKNKRPFILGFGMRNRADFFASGIKNSGKGLEFLVNSKHKFILKTAGFHNIYNALSAITVGRLFGMEYKDMATRLSNFVFLDGRLKVRELNQTKFIDDTYNSNPASLRGALEALAKFKTKGRKIFVMGDMLELGRQSKTFHYRIGSKIVGLCDIFITVGSLSKLAAKAARLSGFDIKNIFTCESCQQARDILFNKISLKKYDTVLLKGSRAMKMEEVIKL